MSKPRAKRKASDANIDDAAMAPAALDASNQLIASLDLSNRGTGPQTIANALLSLLPQGATRQHATAKKLTKAFTLMMAELDARSRSNVLAIARSNAPEVTRLPLEFRFPVSSDNASGEGEMTVVSIPEDSFTTMMKYLKGTEVVKFSLVNKAWLVATRAPVLWERLDRSSGLSNHGGKKINMTSFLKLLGRPQFANLKSLTMPNKVKLGKKSIKQMAIVCPHLQAFEVGYSCYISGYKMKDDDIIEVVETLTNLTTIHIDMWDITNFGIASVARAMEGSLLDLRIHGNSFSRQYISDSALSIIAGSCPNLKHFAYKFDYYPSYHAAERGVLSAAGTIALVRGCRRLEVLELGYHQQQQLHPQQQQQQQQQATRIKKHDFVAILEMLAQGDDASNDGRGFALRKIELKGYPFVIKGNPFRVEDLDT